MEKASNFKIPHIRSWALATDAMVLMEKRGFNSTLALSIASEPKEDLSSADRMAARRLVTETTRRLNFIDRMLNSLLAPSSIGNLQKEIRAFIRIYTFYTWFGQGNRESKGTAAARMGRRILGWRSLNPVEHILGRIIVFDQNQIYKGLDEFETVALETFHPTWFVRYCHNLFSQEEALRFLATSLQIPPTYLRINTLKVQSRDIESTLEKQGMTVIPFEGVENVYEVVRSSRPPVLSKAYREGLFYLQDPASCLAVQAADPKPGWEVLDVCAAPGGKTIHLAQLMEDKGRIVSIDRSERRLGILKGIVRRGGVTIVEAILADAYNPIPLRGEFDLVLLDPPCSSSGTFRKTPSTKWRIDARSFRGYRKIQGSMIDSCSRNVKKGGFLVYSTCSISVEENELVIEGFLEGHPDFQLVETQPVVGRPGLRGLTKCQRLYPHINRTNGFFLAKIQRAS